jgi:RHS repeat-associated protein
MSKSGADPSAVSPPSGTGFTPGLGEAFSLDLNSGQGNYSVSLSLPEGLAGWTPKLKLEYVHAWGQGSLGLGWRLPLRQIDRRLDFGVPEDGVAERFLADDVELVPLGGDRFAPGFESAFSSYARSGDGWLVTERDGTRHELGLAATGRVADPDRPERVQSWLLERSLDVNDNAITYEHELDDGTPYLRQVRWARFSLRLVYEPRPDVHTNGRSGFLRRLARRCARIELFLSEAGGDRKLRTWTLAYATAHNGDSLLASVQMTAHGPAGDGSGDVVRPPLQFEYAAFDPAAVRIDWLEPEHGDPEPPALGDPDVALVGLDDAPLPGILLASDGTQTYWPNNGRGGWGPPRRLTRTPFAAGMRDAVIQLLDADGTGTADLLVGVGATRLPGYYSNDGSSGWGDFVAYPRTARAFPPLESGRVRLGDLNGDGVVDAVYSAPTGLVTYLNNGRAGWAEPTVSPRGTGEDRPNVDFADPLVYLVDMNGDGLPDVVRVGSGSIQYWPHLGHGRFGPRVEMRNSPRLRGLDDAPEELLLIDADGDGCADVVRVGGDGIELALNQAGNAFADPIVHPIAPDPVPGTLRAADMSGEAKPSLLWTTSRAGRSTYVVADLSPGPPPGLLTRVLTGTGVASTISYGAAVEEALRDRDEGRAWTTFFPFPLWVVTSTLEEDEVSGRRTECRYRYRDGAFDPVARRFLGFGTVEKDELGAGSRATTRTTYRFLRDQELLPSNGREHAHLNRLIGSVEVRQLDGSPLEDLPFHAEETEYDVAVLDAAQDGRQRVFVFARRTRKRHFERTSDERSEERTFSYDQLGNVTREDFRAYGFKGGSAVPERLLTTEVTYATSPARGISNLVASIVKRDETGAIVGEVRRYYDGPDYVGLGLGTADRGLLTRSEHLVLPEVDFDAHYAGMDGQALGFTRQPDADGAPAVFARDERRAYDAHGNIVGETDPVGNVTTFGFDPDGLFRIARTDANGTTSFDVDATCGKPERIADPDGSEAELRYDALGRLSQVALGGDNLADPTRRFAYDDASIPNAMRVSYRIDAATRLETVTYYDGGGKEVQKRVEREPGEVVVSGWIDRNPWNQTAAEYEPTLEGSLAFSRPSLGGRPSRTFVYDGEGRPVRTVNYDGGVSTATYAPFLIVTADPTDTDSSPENLAAGLFDTPRSEEVDVLNQRTALTESVSGAEVTTRYRTGLFGELLAYEDGTGEVAAYTYDLAGNRLRIDHRDAGSRRLWYDAGKTVVRTLDPRGNDVGAEYDALGRLVRLTLGGVETETYAYDDTAASGWGRLTEASYAGGAQRFRYNARGQIEEHEFEFDGQPAPLTITYGYDGLGKQTAVTYPDGTAVSYEYYRNGMLRAIPGFVDLAEYDARNLPTKTTFANGVVTEVSYTAGPGRVKTQRTTGPGGELYEDRSYSFDLMQRVRSSADTAPGAQHALEYEFDDLAQLTRVSGTDVSGTYANTYAYANARNLARLDEAGVTLDHGDPLRPDRLTAVDPGGAAPFAVPYDANGNIVGLPGRTFSYDFKNQLEEAVLADGTTVAYAYDHAGRRIRKSVTSAGTTIDTLFLGSMLELRDGQTAIFVMAGKARIALVAGGTTRFIHADPLGSATFFTDETGLKIAQVAYHPFGNVRLEAGSPPGRTFALHEYDAHAGLYFMGRRCYAPEVGRFITPDPLYLYRPERAADRPEALWLYTYVANDPVDNVDPTGLSFWSVVGAIVGVIVGVIVAAVVIAAFVTGIGWGILAVAGVIALVTVSYVVANATAGTGFGEFMRGFLIGLNAGMNAVFLAAIGFALFGPIGIGLGVAVGVINFLAAFDTIANSEVYQGILGWANWLMPMSWLVVGLGLVFFILNLIGHAIGFWIFGSSFFRITAMDVDWKTGTFFTLGGWIGNLNPIDTAFNMGNFSYVDNTVAGNTIAGFMEHESGHTLNLGAFGSIFHFVGAIDENVTGGGANAYSERLAESNDPATTRPNILPMWV